MHQFLLLQDPAHHLFTDASGCGAWSLPFWFCFPWQESTKFRSIALKKLFPIVLACATWGLMWRGTHVCVTQIMQPRWPRSIAYMLMTLRHLGFNVARDPCLCHSDNAAAVAQVNSLHAHDSLASHLLCCLAIFQFAFDFRIRAAHISGSLNIGTDNLYRGCPNSFLMAHPAALPLSTQIDPWMVELLLNDQLDWTSPHWKKQFNSFWQ